MAKKTIQIPIDDDLLQALDRVSQSLQESRSEIIRQACKRYLTEMKNDELDEVYEQGYRNVPEGSELGEMQINVIGQVLPKETW